MRILKKRSILKLAATFMLVAMMAGAFAMHSSVAKAAACGPNNNVSPGTDNNCNVAVNPAIPGQLTFTSDPAVTLTAAAGGSNSFSFGSIVTDERGTVGGWQLQAASTGLIRVTGDTTPIDVIITGSTGSCVIPAAFAGQGSDCPTPPAVTASVTLADTAATIMTEPAGTSPIYSVVTSTSNGTYTIPTDAAPGAYTGTITLSLVATP